MRKSKRTRFCRLTEARVNKIIKMIRLLGSCSGKGVYRYDSEQVEQIFISIQSELDAARRRIYTGKHLFSLSKTCDLHQDILANPHISMTLPDNSVLMAVAFQQDDYPGINIYLEQEEIPQLACFVEYNPERSPCHMVCIGAYQSDTDDITYYEPYMAERETHE